MKVIHESRRFRLSLCRKKSNNRKYYLVTSHTYIYTHEDEEAMRDIADPLRNKSGKRGRQWKYVNFKEAEQVYMMLNMRWS